MSDTNVDKHLPTDAKERKRIPLFTGLVKYFPDALIAVAQVSFAGNEQHNPGQPLHWAREKSTDQEDTLLRHLWESGQMDSDGQRHSAKMAWRALAILQLEIEAEQKQQKQQMGGFQGTQVPATLPLASGKVLRVVDIAEDSDASKK